MSDKKKNVQLDIFSSGGAKSYKGRAIGLIDNEEFKKILENPIIGKKILTEDTIDLDSLKDVPVYGLRLCFVAKEVDGKPREKLLLITEELDMIQHYENFNNAILGFTTKGSGWISVEEDEV